MVNGSCDPCVSNGLSVVDSLCVVCDPTCQQCSGTAATQCTACYSGTYLLSSNNSCVACNTGNPSPSGANCVACDNTCATCTTGASATSCTTCVAGKYLYTANSTCLSCNSNDGYGIFGVNCINCNSECRRCTGTTAIQCTACYSGSYLYLSNSSCVACNTGNPSPLGTNCVACDNTCATCTTGASPTSCLTCVNSRYHNTTNNSCLTCDADGVFISGTSCLDCNSTCRQCTGAGSNQCTSCYSGMYMLSSNNMCVACNTGNPSPSGTSCVACDSTCVTCTTGASPTSCTACVEGRYLENNTCKLCWTSASSPFSCITCSGESSNNCLSCIAGTFLYPNTGGQCLANCPEGYWENESTDTCSQCSNPETDPSSCPGQTPSIVTAVLSPVSSTLPAVLDTTMSAFKQSNTISGRTLNLFLCLSAIESIANMQYLNINHSQIALGAYYGLSSAKGTNWAARSNKLDRDMLIFEYGIFARNGFSSLYLDNFGYSLTSILAYFALYLLFGALSLRKTKEELINGWIGKIYIAVFGLFVSTIAGHLQSQILFSGIQLLKADLSVDVYSRISFVMGYLLFSIIIGLQILCLFKVNTIYNKKMKVIEANSLRDDRIISGRSVVPVNNSISETTQPSIDDRWNEMKYAMLFDSFKETSKHSFFFTYWMQLYNSVYILLILLLQNVPVLQCLSIVTLLIICLLTTAAIKPFKEKSVALIFFSNFTCTLIVAMINLFLAIQAAIAGVANVDNQAGWAIFFLILMNSSANMMVLLGKVIHKLITVLKDRIQRKKKPVRAAAQQIEIERPNHPRNEIEEHNRTSNLQYNNQPNLLPSFSANVDLSGQIPSRQLEAQSHDYQISYRIKKRRRNNE